MSQSDRVHFKIALPTGLKQRLEHEAVEGRRSLSAEIIARLEASLEPSEEARLLADAVRAFMNQKKEGK